MGIGGLIQILRPVGRKENARMAWMLYRQHGPVFSAAGQESINRHDSDTTISRNHYQICPL
jgi:hypothetical protein